MNIKFVIGMIIRVILHEQHFIKNHNKLKLNI